jgi:hypothetical protein
MAPGTVVIEYVKLLPGQATEGPEIGPGTAGTEPGVTALQVKTLQPQPLHALTQIFPEVLPAITVMFVVPCPELIVQPLGTVH